MLTCHSHNLSSGRDGDERNFGLRLSLPAGDSFASVLGADWSTER